MSDDRNADMERRYRAGETCAQIGKRFGISLQRVHDILRKRGVPRAARPLNVDRTRLDWLDNASVDELLQVFGYMGDGNGARWSIDLIRGVQAAPRQVECDRCDGCGWYEGGETLQTRCATCDGTGVLSPKIDARVTPHVTEPTTDTPLRIATDA